MQGFASWAMPLGFNVIRLLGKVPWIKFECDKDWCWSGALLCSPILLGNACSNKYKEPNAGFET